MSREKGFSAVKGQGGKDLPANGDPWWARVPDAVEHAVRGIVARGWALALAVGLTFGVLRGGVPVPATRLEARHSPVGVAVVTEVTLPSGGTRPSCHEGCGDDQAVRNALVPYGGAQTVAA